MMESDGELDGSGAKRACTSRFRSCTVRVELSMRWPAIPRRSPRAARSARMPSATLPPGASGCRRRVSEKRRRSDSSEASRNSTSTWCPPRRTSSMIRGASLRPTPSRASITTAIFATVPWPTPASSVSLGSRATGRLSMQKKPASSSARTAVLFPAPAMPVMTTTCLPAGAAGEVTSLHLFPHRLAHGALGDGAVQPVRELARRVVPLQLEQVVARRHLDAGGHVASGADGGDGERELGAHDVELRLVHAQPVVLGLGVPLHQLHHQLDLLAVPDRGHAEQVLDV